LSIALVFFGHLVGTRNFGTPEVRIGSFHFGLEYSHLGVEIFFVISGFLITSLLIAESNLHGKISIKRFYARRAVRILPPNYAYISILTIFALAGVITVPVSDIWHAVAYVVNCFPGRTWALGHLWSLSVEEQFYLLWPLCFAICGTRRAAGCATALFAAAFFARILGGRLLAGTQYLDLPMFPMVADSIAAGCLLALLRTRLERYRAYLALFRPAPAAATLVIVLLLYHIESGHTVVASAAASCVSLGLAILIHRCVYQPDDRIGRILNLRPVMFVGVLSYSLYVWQQPFLDRHSAALIAAFPQNIFLAVAAAFGSYFLIEKPLFGLRKRLRGRDVMRAAAHA